MSRLRDLFTSLAASPALIATWITQMGASESRPTPVGVRPPATMPRSCRVQGVR
jgi:hypothetical protein